MKKIFQLFALLFVASLLFIKCDAMEAPPAIYATDLTLNVSSLQLAPGDAETLIATVTPGNATHRHLTWVSSDPQVATVNAAGVVTAVANGTATITVTVQGAYRATAAVTVSTALEGISFNVEEIRLPSIGDYQLLTVVFTPATASNQNVTWESSRPAVASVVNGLVTALSSGTTTITVRSEEGGFEATVEVESVGLVRIPLTVDMLYTNAPQAGAGLDNLLSDVSGNYFHTAWGRDVLGLHYIRVDLGAPLSNNTTIVYSFRTRGGGNGRLDVTTMRVESSTDGVTWTIANEQSFDIPNVRWSFVESVPFVVPGAPRYLRFTPLQLRGLAASPLPPQIERSPRAYFDMGGSFSLFRIQ